MSRTDAVSLGILALAVVLSQSPAVAEVRDDRAHADPDDIVLMDLESLLEGFVAVASGDEERASEAPGIAISIDRSTLVRRGYRSIADALRHVANVYVTTDHAGENLGLRGIHGGVGAHSSLILVTLNGIPISNQATTGHALGLEYIPMVAVERIELIRGPASALYGANAFLGAVNVVTRRPLHNAFDVGLTAGRSQGGHLTGSLELSQTYAGRYLQVFVAAAGHRDDASGLALPSSSVRYDEWRETSPSDGAISMPTSLFMQANVHLPRNAGTVGLMAGHQQTNYAGEYHYVHPLTRETTIHQHLGYAAANYDLKLMDDRLRLQSWILYNHCRPGSEDRLDFGSRLLYGVRRFRYDAILGRAEVSYRLSGPARMEVKLGVDGETAAHKLLAVDTRLKTRTDAGAAHSLFSRGERRERRFTNVAIYSQARGWIEDRGSLLAGVRIDDNSAYGQELSWRAAGVVNALFPVYLKLLYGTSFKAPSPLELHAPGEIAGLIEGNSSVALQRAQTLEVQVGFVGGSLQVAGTLFRSAVDDKVEFIQLGGALGAANVSSLVSVGAELEARWLWSSLSLSAQLSYQHTTVKIIDSSETRLLRIVLEDLEDRYVQFPDYMASASADYLLSSVPLRVNLGVKWVGARLTSQDNLSRGAAGELDPFLLLDAALLTARGTARDPHRITLALRISNILDHNAVSPGVNGFDVPGRRRTYWVTVQQDFTLDESAE